MIPDQKPQKANILLLHVQGDFDFHLYLMNVFLDPIVFHDVEYLMIVLAVIVFIALHFIRPGYGMFYTSKWGPTVGNRLGWVLMEAPVLVCLIAIWLSSPRRSDIVLVILMLPMLVHYVQRSLIFPFRLKGKNRMPLAIILLGMTFNVVNAYLIGCWLFYLSPADTYDMEWLLDPRFIAGLAVFLAGMAINLHSDHIIRNLRKPGDRRHYIPHGGMFRYVSSANYLGEVTEWVGYAILTWSLPGAIFALWTFANLGPRARSIYQRYTSEFGDDFLKLNRKYIIPFIW